MNGASGSVTSLDIPSAVMMVAVEYTEDNVDVMQTTEWMMYRPIMRDM